MKKAIILLLVVSSFVGCSKSEPISENENTTYFIKAEAISYDGHIDESKIVTIKN